MNADVKDKPSRSSRDVIWVGLWWLGLSVMLYVLSLGPIMRMVQNEVISEGSPTFTFLGRFYRPIEWGVKEIPVLKRTIGMYVHMWAPKIIDRKGNKVG